MSRQITEDLYKRALAAFRQDPGNILHCAQTVGIARPTAQKLWAGPMTTYMPEGARPIREVLEEEARARHEARLQREADERARAEEEYKRRLELEQEASRMEATALRVARTNTVNGLGALASLAPGVRALAARINRWLETGVDQQGQALDIDPVKGLKVLREFTAAQRDMTLVAQRVIEIHRVQEGLPTATIGMVALGGAATAGGVNMSFEEACQIVAEAQNNVERARRNQLFDAKAQLPPGAVVEGYEEAGLLSARGGKKRRKNVASATSTNEASETQQDNEEQEQNEEREAREERENQETSPSAATSGQSWTLDDRDEDEYDEGDYDEDEEGADDFDPDAQG